MRRFILLILCPLLALCTSESNLQFQKSQEAERVESPRPQALEVMTNSVGMRFLRLPTGSVKLGETEAEGGLPDEGPGRSFALQKPLYFGETEVTQAQWLRVMGGNPSFFQPSNPALRQNIHNAAADLSNLAHHPVENVSWREAQEFIKRLNALERTTRYRLPSEDEWEYVARTGGTTKAFAFTTKRWPVPSDVSTLYSTMRGGLTMPVQALPPNAWGVYGLDGNVREWCADAYRPTRDSAPLRDLKVNRGPCWIDPQNLRIAQRYCNGENVRAPFIGLRVVADEEPAAKAP